MAEKVARKGCFGHNIMDDVTAGDKTMRIFAIADLHLSFNKDVTLYGIDAEKDQYKPMDVFCGWERHFDKIRDNWLQSVSENDTVLIPGDISWAMKLEQAVHDFRWIHQLPGRKVMSPGNHCYYVTTKKKIRSVLPESMEWIDGDYTLVGDYVVVATRGWILPQDADWDETYDRKIHDRQVGRLNLALESARKDHPERPVIAMLHYPPLTTYAMDSDFFRVLKQYDVELCLYGHLHGNAHRTAINGEVDGIELRLVSCDYLNFNLLRVR